MILNTEVEAVKSLAILAGEAIKKFYLNENFEDITNYKSDNSPITLADKAANSIIIEGLKQLFPNDKIISEENEIPDYSVRKNWTRYWLIDPLDGTKEFLSRTGDFTVNIALMIAHKPYFGVVYAPARATLYYGQSENGAFKIEEGSVAKKITVSKSEKALIALGSRLHGSESQLLKKLDIADQIAIGSSLKFCWIAEGKADIYVRENPTMEWDTAAGQAILEAAGGKIKGISNEDFRYSKSNLTNTGFVAWNTHFEWH